MFSKLQEEKESLTELPKDKWYLLVEHYDSINRGQSSLPQPGRKQVTKSNQQLPKSDPVKLNRKNQKLKL